MKKPNSITADKGCVWIHLNGALTVLTPAAAEVIKSQIEQSILKARQQEPASHQAHE